MQKLDPHTLFSIFEQDDQEIYKEHNVEELLDNPYVRVGMVMTGVENFYLIDKMYILRHPEDYPTVRNKVKLKYFNKLFKHLETVTELEFKLIYDIGTDFELDRSIYAINELLYFYQEIEQYEKCATIKKYNDLLVGKKLEVLL